MGGIIDSIRSSGVVGAGGAGFPTHVKLDTNAEVIIVNAAECEPLLRVDQQLCQRYALELVRTLKTLMAVVGAEQGYFGIKKKYGPAVTALQKAIDSEGLSNNIKIFLLKDFYPAGDEQVLVYEITGRAVPEGGIPLMVGTVVVNVETLLNIYFALNFNNPVTEKYVTVTGAVSRPQTLKVPLGVNLSFLLELVGGTTVFPFAVIDGGPLMGNVIKDKDKFFVTKTTKGIIILPEDHPLILAKNQALQVSLHQARSACCQCVACTEICPRFLLGHNLQPHKTMLSISYLNLASAKGLTQSFLCSQCGLCDLYACPMGLSPRKVNQFLQQQLREQKVKNPHQRKDLTPPSFREYRKVPGKRIIERWGLAKWDVESPLKEDSLKAQEVSLSLKQHIGAPAIPVVEKGEKVEKGQLIGKAPENTLGANIHASISGIVKSRDESVIVIQSI
ncbi:MAG: electron transport complex protein RnfC [Clostridia bacterium]|nr:electron transport complex protein RnfC [Clostridia bacterium]